MPSRRFQAASKIADGSKAGPRSICGVLMLKCIREPPRNPLDLDVGATAPRFWSCFAWVCMSRFILDRVWSPNCFRNSSSKGACYFFILKSFFVKFANQNSHQLYGPALDVPRTRLVAPRRSTLIRFQGEPFRKTGVLPWAWGLAPRPMEHH